MMLAVMLLYNWYRYPFQISDSGTSQGYKDTPVALSLGKYLLLVLLLPGFLVSASKRAKVGHLTGAHPRTQLFFSAALIYLAGVPLVFCAANNSTQLLDTTVCWSFGFLILNFGPEPDRGTAAFAKAMKAFGLFSVLFFYFEVFLFVVFDRLPALSYAHSVIVRFGGIWDDPNGFSFIWPLLFPLFIKLRRKWFLTATGVVALLGTESATGVASVVAGLFVALGLRVLFRGSLTRSALKRFFLFAVPLLVAVFAVASVVNLVQLFELASAFTDQKLDSVHEHMHSIDILQAVDVYALLGLIPVDALGESGYVNWVANLGVVYILLVAAVLGMSILKLAVASARPRPAANDWISFAALWFLCAVGIGLTNLPLDHVFPVNLLTTLICGLTLRGGFNTEDPYAREGSQDEIHGFPLGNGSSG